MTLPFASLVPLLKWLRPLLERLLPTNPIKAIQWLTNFLDALRRLRDKIGYHGMYEILVHDSTLELADIKGKKATITRHEKVRFLQDNVIAIHDHAWGDGELFGRYRCQPGVAVDFYEDGSKHNILVSLRETKNRGDCLELWIERVIGNGFVKREEWFEVEIDHLMRRLKRSIIFPKGRPCRRATLSRRSTGKVTPLPQKRFALLPDGRQKLTWETRHPRLHDLYTIKWAW